MSEVLNELARRIACHTRTEAVVVPPSLPRMILMRATQRQGKRHHLSRPALCMVAQGAKQTVFGEKRFEYRAGQALVVSVESPAVSTILEASETKPYLALALELDLSAMREVIGTIPVSTAPQRRAPRETRHGVFVADLNEDLLRCVLRMVQLLATPEAIGALYPAIMREIAYRLLSGPHAAEVVAMTIGKGHARPVVEAIHQLRARFAEPLRIGELAAVAGMSLSTFHRQFKALTSLTPIQYQKQFRLLEARRRMLAEEANVETAAFGVGYESASQFSREYARMFGLPPRRDIASLGDPGLMRSPAPS